MKNGSEVQLGALRGFVLPPHFPSEAENLSRSSQARRWYEIRQLNNLIYRLPTFSAFIFIIYNEGRHTAYIDCLYFSNIDFKLPLIKTNKCDYKMFIQLISDRAQGFGASRKL